MATRKEVMGAVQRVASLNERYLQIGQERAAVDRERWETLRESQWLSEASTLVDVDTRLGDVNTRLTDAFGELGRAIVDMHSLRGAGDTLGQDGLVGSARAPVQTGRPD